MLHVKLYSVGRLNKWNFHNLEINSEKNDHKICLVYIVFRTLFLLLAMDGIPGSPYFTHKTLPKYAYPVPCMISGSDEYHREALDKSLFQIPFQIPLSP